MGNVFSQRNRTVGQCRRVQIIPKNMTNTRTHRKREIIYHLDRTTNQKTHRRSRMNQVNTISHQRTIR
ncbi:unnamed protein product, partial [Allacma fusca]